MKNNSYKVCEIFLKWLWVIIILPKMAQFAVLILSVFIIMLNSSSTKTKLDSFAKLTIVYSMIHLFSIAINAFDSASISRIAAGINTALIWVVAALFYSFVSSNDISIQDTSKYCFRNHLILILFFIVARILYYCGKTSYYLPVLGNVLFWQEGNYSRFTAFMEYPTLVVPFTLLMMPGTLYFVYKSTVGRFGKKIAAVVVIIYYVISFLPIYVCYSRMGYVLYLLTFACLILFWMRSHLGNQSWKILFSLTVFGVCILMVLFLRTDMGILDKLLSMREGSNSTRMIIYRESFEHFSNKPILGCGIKEISSVELPLGSHSTYIGLLYKTGIIGTLVICTAFAGKIKEYIKAIIRIKRLNMYKVLSLFLAMIFVFALLEDLDGVDWLICLFYSLIGIQKSMSKQENDLWENTEIENSY